jgi:predicted tellurium resistance membrane protein TerC
VGASSQADIAVVMEWLVSPNVWASVLTLSVLEIVLGIDNLIFLSILAARLPPAQQARARQVGLVLALAMRLGLLAAISWIMGLTALLFAVAGHEFSWRDLILIGGGLFLVYKGTQEIHARIEGEGEHGAKPSGYASFASTIVQIGVLDLVFSLDSVITAVGMANELPIMVAAVVIAMAVMLVAAGPVSGFINRHPTVKMLALSFLLLIGMVLIADGFGVHVPKGYIYAAIGFSIAVELLNQFAGRRRRLTSCRVQPRRRGSRLSISATRARTMRRRPGED